MIFELCRILSQDDHSLYMYKYQENPVSLAVVWKSHGKLRTYFGTLQECFSYTHIQIIIDSTFDQRDNVNGFEDIYYSIWYRLSEWTYNLKDDEGSYLQH